MSRDFILMTDASGYAIGAVLGQKVEGEKDHVIAYISRTLNKHERNYSTIEREGLAIVFATRQFRHYILGKKIWLLTDQMPLVNVMRKKNSSHRLVRWALELQEYDIEFGHRTGKANANADFLSRLDLNKERMISALNQTDISPIDVTPESELELEDAQRHDEEIDSLRQVCEGKKDLTTVVEKSLLDHLKRNKTRYLVVKGILKFIRKADDLIVLPQKYRKHILLTYHDGALGGHRSCRRTLGAIIKKYYWPGIENDVKIWCQTCQICASRRDTGRQKPVPLKPIPPPTSPMEITAMDVLGPFNMSTQGNVYIIVFCDYFTKWPEAYPMPNQKAETIAQIFVEHIVYRYGVPKKLLTDQGTNFMSDLLNSISKIFHILRIHTSPYHPQTDGMVERFNRTLANMLSSYTNAKQTDWDLHIPSCLFAYRSAPHASTGETPFYLMYLRHPGMPEDIHWIRPQSQYMDVVDYKIVMLERLQTAWNKAGLQMKFSQETMKENYDKKTKEHKFEVGDHVLLHHPFTPQGLSGKLRRPFKGPYTVIGVTPTNLKLKNETNKKADPIIVHVNRCKLIAPEATSSRYPLRSQTVSSINSESDEPSIHYGLMNRVTDATGEDFIRVNIIINGMERQAIMDSGSSYSATREVPEDIRICKLDQPLHSRSMDGKTITVTHKYVALVTVHDQLLVIEMKIIPTLPFEYVIGMDVIKILQSKGVLWLNLDKYQDAITSVTRGYTQTIKTQFERISYLESVVTTLANEVTVLSKNRLLNQSMTMESYTQRHENSPNIDVGNTSAGPITTREEIVPKNRILRKALKHPRQSEEFSQDQIGRYCCRACDARFREKSTFYHHWQYEHSKTIPRSETKRDRLTEMLNGDTPSINMIRSLKEVSCTPHEEFEINGKKIQALMDSGSDISIVSWYLLTKPQQKDIVQQKYKETLKTANGSKINIIGRRTMQFGFDGFMFDIDVRISKQCAVDCVIGFDIIQELEKRRLRWTRVVPLSRQEIRIE